MKSFGSRGLRDARYNRHIRPLMKEKKMNDEYTYEEEASLSADRDLFDEYRFTSGDEDRIYEAESGELPTNPAV